MKSGWNVIFNLIGLFFVIFFSVDIFYLILQKEVRLSLVTKRSGSFSVSCREYKRPSFNEYKSIVQKNIFGIKKQDLSSGKIIANKVIKPTSLKLLLIGTAVAGPENSVAIIRDLVKRQDKCYRVGDIIQGAVIREIQRGKVILGVNGKEEALFMKGKKEHKEDLAAVSGSNEYNKPIYPSENERVVHRSRIESSFKNLQKLMSQVRIRPYFKGGRPYGMMVSNIKKGSIFEELGLKNGDIIQDINGRPLKGVGDFVSLYKDINSNYKISLGIERQGKTETIDLLIK
ncbi:MAG: hypothetical protein DRG39_01530 [Deltaproteobacteria bacterium]|nr:MAG: hypothetical protein DRG39_01530 [Deltaproteobacteria bacterium]